MDARTEAKVEFEGAALSSTVSIGIAEFPRHGLSADDLLSQADNALYMAKRAGRNRAMAWR